jgi:hypothetical protein
VRPAMLMSMVLGKGYAPLGGSMATLDTREMRRRQADQSSVQLPDRNYADPILSELPRLRSFVPEKICNAVPSCNSLHWPS